MDIKTDLEYDLFKTEWIVTKCQNDIYAQNLYAALCNNIFLKNDEEWSCSWRHSGGIVADLRNQGEDYLDWYCSGTDKKRIQGYVGEGEITTEISNDLLNIGWHYKPY